MWTQFGICVRTLFGILQTARKSDKARAGPAGKNVEKEAHGKKAEGKSEGKRKRNGKKRTKRKSGKERRMQYEER